MGRIKQLLGWESSDRFGTITADNSLFGTLKDELPDEPLIELQPQKENPGLEHGPELVRSLWHYRQDSLNHNTSPVNSFEIWFDEGEIRFYFHPDSQEQKNSARKHFEDKFPGTRMEEEPNPFPQINEGDAIAGAQMTLRNNFVRPLRVPNGPAAASYKRDPFGSLTSDMVAENEQTASGERVEPEDVRMMVQVMFQPAARSWSQGGLFGTDVNDYANELKQPKTKSGFDQTLRMVFGLEPKERKPTAKMKKTAKMVSELRGEPGFLFRIRVISISPYEEIAKQHAERVCEAFEMYDNPVTEQSLEILPYEGDKLREMLKKMAGREMCYSTLAKMLSGKDLVSVPELAGMVHLPNETIQSPEVNWTTMKKGAGVPTSTPDLEDIDEKIKHQKETQEEDPTSQPATPRTGTTNSDQDRWQEITEETLQGVTQGQTDLKIESSDGPDEIPGRDRGPEITSDGRGIETDRLLPDQDESGDGEESDRTKRDEETTDTDETNDGSDVLSQFLSSGSDLLNKLDYHDSSEEREDPDKKGAESEQETGQGESERVVGANQLVDDNLEAVEPDWEEINSHGESESQGQQPEPSPTGPGEQESEQVTDPSKTDSAVERDDDREGRGTGNTGGIHGTSSEDEKEGSERQSNDGGSFEDLKDRSEPRWVDGESDDGPDDTEDAEDVEQPVADGDAEYDAGDEHRGPRGDERRKSGGDASDERRGQRGDGDHASGVSEETVSETDQNESGDEETNDTSSEEEGDERGIIGAQTQDDLPDDIVSRIE
jgi:hypothetical protein